MTSQPARTCVIDMVSSVRSSPTELRDVGGADATIVSVWGRSTIGDDTNHLLVTSASRLQRAAAVKNLPMFRVAVFLRLIQIVSLNYRENKMCLRIIT